LIKRSSKPFYNLSLRVKVKENGEDREDREDNRNVGLDKHLTNSNKRRTKSNTNHTPWRLPESYATYPTYPTGSSDMMGEDIFFQPNQKPFIIAPVPEILWLLNYTFHALRYF
jgi:hypothetical protein